MDSNFLQSVLGQRVPQGPVSQLPLFQRADSSVPPGMAPEPPPTSGLSGGYPGQPAAIPDFTQRPPAQVTQLPVETPQTFAGNPLDQWRAAAGKASMFTAPEQPSYGPALDQWRVAHGKATPPTNADVVLAAIKSAPQGATPALAGAPMPQSQPQGQPQGQPAAQQKGVLSEDFLKSLPKMQSEAIRSMGGISHRDLLALLHGNMQMQAQQLDPTWRAKSDMLAGQQGIAFLENNGIHRDEKTGAYTARNGMTPEKTAEAIAEYEAHLRRVNGAKVFFNNTNALPGMGGS